MEYHAQNFKRPKDRDTIAIFIKIAWSSKLTCGHEKFMREGKDCDRK